MKSLSFERQDFQVFEINGLDERMNQIKEHIRPKLEALGLYFAPFFTEALGEDVFPHVAKHARRSVNPPNDTWVAFATNKRGYKMLPHFQIGLWNSHIFIYFGLIYECPQKSEYARAFSFHLDSIKQCIPPHFVWSVDHTKPTAKTQNTLSAEELDEMFNRLATVKKAELLCGIHLRKEDAVNLNDEQFVNLVKETFHTLIPLYKLTASV
ncbi:DUF1054 domain-containing protein [Bacillus sp. 165]|uniref:YktB family protein n=1 Tax=Bacillus sp. 165 TaxID=1529117 RepID=UPI001ADBC53D|nr:DUF1054 domain-containing protein [Bacillus sp. 165]MBO9130317.1 DUF1054 domain-containing protein [Bacillus sp. 165]